MRVSFVIPIESILMDHTPLPICFISRQYERLLEQGRLDFVEDLLTTLGLDFRIKNVANGVGRVHIELIGNCLFILTKSGIEFPIE